MSGGRRRGRERERVVARVRRSARMLVPSVVLLVATAFGAGYLGVLGPLRPDQRILVWVGAGIVVALGVIWPFLRWLAERTTITDRRLIAHRGLVPHHRVVLELDDAVDVALRRGPLQFLFGTGDLRVNGAVRDAVLRDVPGPARIQSALLALIAEPDGPGAPDEDDEPEQADVDDASRPDDAGEPHGARPMGGRRRRRRP